MNKNQQPITEDRLIKIFEKEVMLPVAEKINELSNELGGKIDKLEKAHLKLDIKFDRTVESMKQEMQKNKDEIITSNIELAGKLKNDEEKKSAKKMFSTLANIKFKEHDEIFKKHDNRIKVLELQPA